MSTSGERTRVDERDQGEKWGPHVHKRIRRRSVVDGRNASNVFQDVKTVTLNNVVCTDE